MRKHLHSAGRSTPELQLERQSLLSRVVHRLEWIAQRKLRNQPRWYRRVPSLGCKGTGFPERKYGVSEELSAIREQVPRDAKATNLEARRCALHQWEEILPQLCV